MQATDSASLVAGLALMVLGVLLLLDRVHAIDLTFGYLWPSLLAAAGVILLATGLSQRHGR